MTRLLLLSLFVLTAAPSYAQLSPTLARMVAAPNAPGTVPGSAIGGDALVTSGEIISVVIRTDDPAALEARGIQIVTRLPGLVTALVTLGQVEDVLAMESVRAVEYEYETSYNDAAAVLTGARALQQGIVGGQSYDGTGVLACVLDSGIDWRHWDFRVAGDTTQTRILRLWDQTDTATGSTDAPGTIGGTTFSYGAEWDEAEIEAAFSNPSAIRQSLSRHSGVSLARLGRRKGHDARNARLHVPGRWPRAGRLQLPAAPDGPRRGQ